MEESGLRVKVIARLPVHKCRSSITVFGGSCFTLSTLDVTDFSTRPEFSNSTMFRPPSVTTSEVYPGSLMAWFIRYLLRVW